jgi:uncharacterized membrane protein
MTKLILKHIRAKIFAGILVVLPLGITFLVLMFVFNSIEKIINPLIPKVTVTLFHHDFYIPGLGIIGFLVLLYFLGLIATNVIGRKLVSLGDRLFTAIPVVKNIYISSKQLTDAFSQTRRGSFRQAVFVEFPQQGNYVLGFITNELKDLDNQKKVTVFLPTAFIPPQGILLFLPKDKIIPSNFTIEEAIKAIMSVGIVTPNIVNTILPEPKSKVEKNENFNFVKLNNQKTEGGF